MRLRGFITMAFGVAVGISSRWVLTDMTQQIVAWLMGLMFIAIGGLRLDLAELKDVIKESK